MQVRLSYGCETVHGGVIYLDLPVQWCEDRDEFHACCIRAAYNDGVSPRWLRTLSASNLRAPGDLMQNHWCWSLDGSIATLCKEPRTVTVMMSMGGQLLSMSVGTQMASTLSDTVSNIQALLELSGVQVTEQRLGSMSPEGVIVDLVSRRQLHTDGLYLGTIAPRSTTVKMESLNFEDHDLSTAFDTYIDREGNVRPDKINYNLAGETVAS